MTLEKQLEAMLFAVGAPMTVERIASLTGETPEAIHEAAAQIEGRLSAEDSGIQLIKIEEGYQLCTKPETGDIVKKALELKKAPPLSKSNLEVLAIVAYNQPVTRSFIEQVRGVDSSYVVSGLLDKGLIAERGQLDAPGRPTLFGTTDAFLRCFGLESIDDLPKNELAMMGEQVSLDLPEEASASNEPAKETTDKIEE